MKKYISLAMTALFVTTAVSIAGPENEALMAKEKAAWQAFKDKKADDFKKVVHPDMIGIYAEGISDMKKEMADMQKWDMKSFAISDYKVVPVGSDTAVTTYKVALQGTYDGKDASGNFNAGSVWKMDKGGGWIAIFHTNVKEAPATK
jgi:ketosteroid isomerase-like protein